MSERLTVDDVKGDILDAFDMLKERAGRGAALDEANNSEVRVLTFLVQCEADAKQLEAFKAALADCVEVMGWNHGPAYTNAKALLGL